MQFTPLVLSHLILNMCQASAKIDSIYKYLWDEKNCKKSSPVTVVKMDPDNDYYVGLSPKQNGDQITMYDDCGIEFRAPSGYFVVVLFEPRKTFSQKEINANWLSYFPTLSKDAAHSRSSLRVFYSYMVGGYEVSRVFQKMIQYENSYTPVEGNTRDVSTLTNTKTVKFVYHSNERTTQASTDIWNRDFKPTWKVIAYKRDRGFTAATLQMLSHAFVLQDVCGKTIDLPYTGRHIFTWTKATPMNYVHNSDCEVTILFHKHSVRIHLLTSNYNVLRHLTKNRIELGYKNLDGLYKIFQTFDNNETNSISDQLPSNNVYAIEFDFTTNGENMSEFFDFTFMATPGDNLPIPSTSKTSSKPTSITQTTPTTSSRHSSANTEFATRNSPSFVTVRATRRPKTISERGTFHRTVKNMTPSVSFDNITVEIEAVTVSEGTSLNCFPLVHMVFTLAIYILDFILEYR